MATEKEIFILKNAIGSIEDAIAGIREIKAAMGMTEQSHMERDLLASIRRIEVVINTDQRSE